MCSKKGREYISLRKQNKDCILFYCSQKTQKKNPVNNLDVVNFTDLCFVSVSKPREKTYKIFTYFSSEGTTGKPNSIRPHLKVASLSNINKFQNIVKM